MRVYEGVIGCMKVYYGICWNMIVFSSIYVHDHGFLIVLDNHGFLILLDYHRFLILLDHHGFLILLDNHDLLILLDIHEFLILLDNHRFLILLDNQEPQIVGYPLGTDTPSNLVKINMSSSLV